MQRPASSSRAASSDQHHVIDITQQQQQNAFSLYNRRFRSSRERWCHVIHAIPLVVFFCIFVLWWFSYPVNLEIKDGRLISARKIEVPPQLVNETRIDHTILMKHEELTPPPDPSVLSNTTLMNDTSSVSPKITMMNDTSAEPPVQPD